MAVGLRADSKSYSRLFRKSEDLSRCRLRLSVRSEAPGCFTDSSATSAAKARRGSTTSAARAGEEGEGESCGGGPGVWGEGGTCGNPPGRRAMAGC